MRRKSTLLAVIALSVLMVFLSTAYMCGQSPYETKQDDLYKRTGQYFEDWSDNLDDLDKMEAELDRIEKESGPRGSNWTKEEIDALKEKILKEKEETEVAEEDEEITTEAEESITSEPAETMAVSSGKDILGGIWVGELKKTKLTGTVTGVYDDERGTVTVDVNELWGWWLEEPPGVFKFELAKANGGYIRSDISPEYGVATNFKSDVFFNENIFVMTNTGKVGEQDFYQKFTGILEEENLLKGTYEVTIILADPGGMEYGEWWAERQ